MASVAATSNRLGLCLERNIVLGRLGRAGRSLFHHRRRPAEVFSRGAGAAAPMLASLELEAGTLTQGPDNGRHRSQPPPGQSGDWAVQTADAGLASVAGVTRTAGLVRGEEGAAGLVPGCGGVAGAAGAPA